MERVTAMEEFSKGTVFEATTYIKKYRRWLLERR